MIVTVEQMKTYLQIDQSDTSHDVFLLDQISLIQSAMENYCGRKFDEQTYIETYYRDEVNQDLVPTIFTTHYPIVSIEAVTEGEDEVVTYRLNKSRGQITRMNDCFRKETWFQSEQVLEVSYTAGYTSENSPRELQQVIYGLVSENYNKRQAGIDINFGSNVQRVSVAGVMSIDFDYTLNSNERKNAFGIILGDWANVLDRFRSEQYITGKIMETYL